MCRHIIIVTLILKKPQEQHQIVRRRLLDINDKCTKEVNNQLAHVTSEEVNQYDSDQIDLWAKAKTNQQKHIKINPENIG